MPKATNLEQFLNSPGSYDVVELSCKNFTDDDCMRLGVALNGHQTLININLYGDQIGDVGAVLIAQGLNDLPLLNHLSFAKNQIGDIGAVAIAKKLNGLPSLIHLFFYENQIGMEGAIAIADGINGMSLSSFRFDGNEVKPGVIVVRLQQKWYQTIQLELQQALIEKDEKIEKQNNANSAFTQQNKDNSTELLLGNVFDDGLRQRTNIANNSTQTHTDEQQTETDVVGDSWWNSCCDHCTIL